MTHQCFHCHFIKPLSTKSRQFDGLEAPQIQKIGVRTPSNRPKSIQKQYKFVSFRVFQWDFGSKSPISRIPMKMTTLNAPFHPPWISSMASWQLSRRADFPSTELLAYSWDLSVLWYRSWLKFQKHNPSLWNSSLCPSLRVRYISLVKDCVKLLDEVPN